MTLVAVLALLLCVVDLSLQADQCSRCTTTTTGLMQCRSYTPELGISHCGELDQTVNSLESAFGDAAPIPPAFFGAKGFLRVLAFVETRDGRNWTCCENGGIWKVDYESLHQCAQSFSDIQVIIASATGAFGIQSSADYDCPINSAFGAVLLMLCNMVSSTIYRNVTAAAADLPTGPDSFPSFYARYYCHPSCSESEAMEKFTVGMQEYLSTPCGPAVDSCSEQFDIIVLLDSSGSIGAGQFTEALTAVANLSSRYTIGSDYTRFSVILYSHIIHNTREEDVIALDEYSDSANLTAAILSLPYHRGGTLTGSSITYAAKHGFNRSFGARESGTVPRILIVATDGHSSDDVKGPAKAAADDGIILFSIGIGDGSDQEQLLDIAGGVSSRVFNTADYRHLIGLSPLLAAESCRAQVSVPPGKQVEYTLIMGEVKYFQISIPENCSQSLMVSFVANSSSDSAFVYASFTIPNPNKRLYDYKWNVTAEQVNVTIPSKECTRKRRQAPPPDHEQSRKLFFSLELESSSNGTAEFMLTTDIIETPEDSRLSLAVTELQHSQSTLMYSCTATCSCPSATIAWEKGLSLPLAAKVTVSEDGRQTNITIDTTAAGHNGHYTCIIQTPGVIGMVEEIVTVNLRCENNGTNISPFICDCPAGWTGLACDQPVCSPVCANGGTCVAPQQCSCVEGWAGSSCDIAVCSIPCLNGGHCSAPDRCTCSTGWEGQSCSAPVCSPECANGGTCVAPQQCSCVEGWAGSSCDIAVCSPDCVNGGTCVATNHCTCPPGWTGATCSQAICSPPCQIGGSCISPDRCVCSQGWTGPDCSQPVCSVPCLNGGHCSAPDRCTCSTGWEGQNCSAPVCSPTCKNGGTCLSSPATCTCVAGWNGTFCEEAVCSPGCANGGMCILPGHCQCSPEWNGSTCNESVCTPLCLNGGTCATSGDCHCPEGWTGTSCETAFSPAASQHIAAIVLVPLLLLLAVALVVAIAGLAVKYRRRRAVYQVEGTTPRRTSILQEVGQTVKKKLSVISGSFPYTETVSGSESVEHIYEITEEDGEDEEEEGKL